jgi:hypothetical protein
LSVEVIARGSRSPLLMGYAPPDPILRYLALIGTLDRTGAPPFGPHARNARVILLRSAEPSPANGGPPP